MGMVVIMDAVEPFMTGATKVPLDSTNIDFSKN